MCNAQQVIIIKSKPIINVLDPSASNSESKSEIFGLTNELKEDADNVIKNQVNNALVRMMNRSNELKNGLDIVHQEEA